MTYYVGAYATNSIGTAYGNEISFVTIFPNCGAITDVDGNIYVTVTIGSQCWLQENLKTTKYNDMTDIPFVTGDSEWEALTTAGYCWYDNNAADYKSAYGSLYNWYSVSVTTNGGKNVCPTGWHVPVDAEWTVLANYLGGADVGGGKLMEAGTSHWVSQWAGPWTQIAVLPGITTL